MRVTKVVAATLSICLASAVDCSTIPHAEALREYAGVYQWGPDAFTYLQLWNELTGTHELAAFDESGAVRILYREERDRFVTGPAAALREPIESRMSFQRDRRGKIISLIEQPEGSPARIARRVEIERHEEVRFANGDIQLAGTLIKPATGRRHPAIILVHGSGPLDRLWMVPFARFLVRRGMALLTYDKRGVGGSTGDWNTASFDDLADDVVAAFEFLKTRRDIDHRRIGMLGVSQAGWVMPLAANRAKDMAFLISVSGAAVTPAETTLDQARNEMRARGMRPETVNQIVGLMRLQYDFARTGSGWEAYAAARKHLGERLGSPPESFPGTPDHRSWEAIRRLYFYDPAPALSQLQLPVLAIFGELDTNILADKNKTAWSAALEKAGNGDYTMRVIPKANHLQLESAVGSNAEMKSLRRFVPAYFSAIEQWLAQRTSGFGAR